MYKVTRASGLNAVVKKIDTPPCRRSLSPGKKNESFNLVLYINIRAGEIQFTHAVEFLTQ